MVVVAGVVVVVFFFLLKSSSLLLITLAHQRSCNGGTKATPEKRQWREFQAKVWNTNATINQKAFTLEHYDEKNQH
jgi:hypothetical protein